MSDARSLLAALVEAFDRNRGKGLAFAHAIDDGIEQARTFLAASPATLPAIDVPRLARALTKEYRYLGRRPESEDDFLRFATVLVAAYEKPE